MACVREPSRYAVVTEVRRLGKWWRRSCSIEPTRTAGPGLIYGEQGGGDDKEFPRPTRPARRTRRSDFADGNGWDGRCTGVRPHSLFGPESPTRPDLPHEMDETPGWN